MQGARSVSINTRQFKLLIDDEHYQLRHPALLSFGPSPCLRPAVLVHTQRPNRPCTASPMAKVRLTSANSHFATFLASASDGYGPSAVCTTPHLSNKLPRL